LGALRRTLVPPALTFGILADRAGHKL
jgi:hypothetical protein